MSATVNVLCYKSKKMKNGEHPLMLRICKGGEKRYVSLGISVNPKYWDFEKNKPRRNCPQKEHILELIMEQEKLYSDQLLEYAVAKKDYSASSLINSVENIQKVTTVGAMFEEFIRQLKRENRVGYALSVSQVYQSLLKYKKMDIAFTEIDVAWLKNYESWLRASHLAENTIGIRMRTLRVIYNLAIMDNIVKSEYYPFKKYKVSKLHKETAKRAITKDQMKKIMAYDTSRCCFYKKLAVDMFVFSYLMGGINFTDMFLLTAENINDGRLIYVRQKTKKTILLPLSQQAASILAKYRDLNRKYLFPVLDNNKRTAVQVKDRIYDVLSNVNRHLRSIGRSLGFELKITTYVARHSYATVLKRAGVSTSIISESLGHSSERVTQIYLDSFDNEQINNAMKELL